MRVFVECSTEAMKAELCQMVEQVEHVLAGQPHNALVLLIDDGFSDLLHRIARVRALQPAIEPVVIVHAAGPEEVPSLAKDFLVSPVRPEELRARLDRIAMRRTNAGTRYEDLLAMAVEATGDVIEIRSAHAARSVPILEASASSADFRRLLRHATVTLRLQ